MSKTTKGIFRASASNIINTLQWKSLEERRREGRLCMMYKITSNLVDVNKEGCLKQPIRRSRNTRDRSYMQVPSCSSDYRKESFFPRTIREWNSLHATRYSVSENTWGFQTYKEQIIQSCQVNWISTMAMVYSAFRYILSCTSLLILMVEVNPAASAPIDGGQSGTISDNAVILSVTLVAAVLLLSAVLFVFLCGGCTGMEVGTESHPASSGGKSDHYNDHMITSSMAFPDNNPAGGATDQSMPYSLNPTIPSAPGFAGYQQVPQSDTSGWGGGGYGQTNAPPTQGYGTRSPGPNAHRSPFDTEPPPPSYNESMSRDSDFVSFQR
ncbi:hypothetical protein FSP39_022655 [Pinctada imbricata]|uniref:Uncharacterized protein n=1 Tax=Pinctada imbricata TaxID=66713 RepID=A0AA88YFM4_PINIB|nr:hypothetical protein FSP39_022655 [Pinctada imbricata]